MGVLYHMCQIDRIGGIHSTVKIGIGNQRIC